MVLGVALLAAAVMSGPAKAEPARPATGLLRRSYDFVQAGKAMPYQLYVPSSYDGSRAFPLVMVLHGAGGDEKSVFAGSGLAEQAERRGVIVAAPLGYNAFGGWGDIYPTVVTRHTAESGAERLKALSKSATGAPEERSAGTAPVEAPARADEPHVDVPADQLASPDISRLSEADALNVLERVRAEYRIDPGRIYLMGNSMGGVGTLFLAAKHPQIWAAIAPAGGVVAAWSYPVERLRAHRIAALIVHGELDEHAHWSKAKALADAGRAGGADVRMLIVPKGSHGRAWATALPQTFDFFLAHRRMAK